MNNKFEQKSKKPLHQYPSAKREGRSPVHWRKSRTRLGKTHYVKRFLQIFALIFILGGGVIASYFWAQFQNNNLRDLAEEKLSQMLGNQMVPNIDKVDLAIGGNNFVNVDVSQLELKNVKTQLDFLNIDKISLGVSSLGLIQGKLNLNSIELADVEIALPAQKKQPKSARAKKQAIEKIDLKRILKLIHGQLNKNFTLLEENNFKALSVKEVTITGLKQYGLQSDVLLMKSLSASLKGENTWLLNAEFEDQGKLWSIKADWGAAHKEEFFSEKLAKEQAGLKHFDEISPNKNSLQNKHLDFELSGFELSEYFDHNFDLPEKFALDGKVDLAVHLSYDENGEPLDAVASMIFNDALMKMPRLERKDFEETILNFSILADENKLILEPSKISSGENKMVFVGEFDFNTKKRMVDSVNRVNSVSNDDVLKEAALEQPTLELPAIGLKLSTQKAMANAQNANVPAVPYILAINGSFIPASKQLDVGVLNVDSPQGQLRGSLFMDFKGKSPALKTDLTITNMSVPVVKQLWPYFAAYRARNWVLKNVHSGHVDSASIKIDFPHGILGHIHKGVPVNKEFLQIKVPIKNGSFTAHPDLPKIEDVDTVFIQQGLDSHMTLERGFMKTASQKINLAKSTVDIIDDLVLPSTIKIIPNIDGDIRDVLGLVQGKPFSAKLPDEISPKNVSGQIKGKANLQFLLKPKLKKGEVKWSSSFDVLNFKTKKPIVNSKFSAKKLRVNLDNSKALVKGQVSLDGILTKINLNQPLGVSGKNKPRKLSLTVDKKLRKHLGINVEDFISGKLPVEIEFNPNGKGFSFSADLKNTKLSLPWVNWSKGKGIAGKLKFDYIKDNKTTRLNNFRLTGNRFAAIGKLELLKGSLLKANFSKITLNQGDSFRLNLSKKSNIYKLDILGTSYDARAVIKSIIGGSDKAQSDIQKRGGLDLKLAIARLKGFNKQILRNAAVDIKYRNGQLTGMDFSGVLAQNSNFTLSIHPKGNAMEADFSTQNAGAVFNFFNIYKKMRGGLAYAKLLRRGNGPYKGDATFRDFVIVHEPRLKELVSQPVKDYTGRDKSLPIDPSAVKFIKAEAQLEKGSGYLKVKHGLIRNDTIGSSFNGTVFDKRRNMSLVGTFMPAYGINRLFGKIPVLGILLGNGREGGLFGITYKLQGNVKNPKISLNPLSVVTPGIFREIFQFKEQ